ncbi:MAG: MoaD/ThiS family protein, partial [Phycisphaerae bacterium]|nr:MoaD/ThiS family protein [Phycisphaerae bacterium]
LRPQLASARLAVNHEFAAFDRPISPEDEVALIAMVSGG